MGKKLDSVEYYLNIAKVVSSKSTCLKKHYGAVIIKNQEIIATGFNGACRHEWHCETCTKKQGNKDFDEYFSCPAVHAEMNAIISASRQEMIDSVLYLAGIDAVTGEEIAAEPCEICLRLIKNAGIRGVINNSGVIYKRGLDGILRPTKVRSI